VYRSKKLRVGVLLLAAFHLGVATAVPIADALLELASVGVRTHVESARESACGDGHEHVFCQLCRTVGLAVLPRVTARGCATPEVTTYGTLPNRDSDARHVTLSGSIGPRAPPLA
jgi:hypothetical protein